MLTTPVLQLDAARMHEIDPRNVESLFGMWTVFSRCATSIPDGKRLENLSWRVWARETLCCPPQPDKTIVPAIDISPARSSGVPSLSTSVDSDASSDENRAFAFSSRTERTRKLSESEDSAFSKSRGKEPHLTSHTLEKIVTTIQEKSELGPLSPHIKAVVDAKMPADSPLDPLSRQESPELTSSRRLPYSTESSCISTTTAGTVSTARQSEHRDSETSVSSTEGDGLIRSGSVVHGFSPAASSYRSSRNRMSQGLVSLASSNRASQNLKAPNKSNGFLLGASSEDEESSFEQRMAPHSSNVKKAVADKRPSSLSQTVATKNPTTKGGNATFKAILEQHRLQKQADGDSDDGAIESSEDEDDDIESAIGDEEDEDEDDEGEWEDSHSDDGKAAHEPVFKRIDSRPNLVSRRSVLTQGLNEKERASGLLSAATQSANTARRSRNASLNGPSMPGSPESPKENDEDSGMMMQRSKGSKPLPIIPTTTNTYAMAHSPRTTRRNMLSTELTQSLRQNLLWERQQKNTTVNAFLKRQAQSAANLTRLNQQQQQQQQQQSPLVLPVVNGKVDGGVRPSAPYMPKEDGDKVTKNNSSWNHFFDTPWEYHAKGW